MSDTLLFAGRPAQPIRLRVSYKSPESLVGEFTRSVGKGGVALESRRKLEVGTRFVFELWAQGVDRPVEVLGEVVKVTPAHSGKWLLGIRYDRGQDNGGLDAALGRILDAHRYEKVRKFPRIPLQLRATEDTPYSPSYLLRDLSRGGAGLEIESTTVPRTVRPGVPFLLELWTTSGTLALHGEIAWVFTPPAERIKWVNPAFGVGFGKLRQDTVERLERILALRGLPPPPWKARVSFGMDAVSRMP